jgi:acetyl esterase/lipase
MKKISLAVCLAIATAPALLSQDKTASHVQTDVLYGKGGEQELKLDIAMPSQGQGPFPTVVCLHGGAWRGGKRTDLAATIRTLASKGYVAATVQYRLCPECKFPSQIEDCKCAVRFLRANAAKYRIDTDRIGALGFSAGGHLVCMLGLTTREDGLEGKGDLSAEQAKQSSRVQAVCSFFGPTDFTKNDWNRDVQPLLTDFFGGLYEEKKELYLRGSPITYARKDAANPVFLFFHGTDDTLVPYVQSVRLLEALKKVGTKADIITVEGEKHGWGGAKLRQSVDQMMEFFDGSLKNKK